MNYKNIFLSAVTISVFTALQTGAQGQAPTAPAGRPPVAPGRATPAATPVAPAAPAQAAPAPSIGNAPNTSRVTRPAAPVKSKIPMNPKNPNQLVDFAFEQADLDIVMQQYCEWTDQIYLKTDAVKASITMKADKLPVSEAIKVVEAILAMNNIALVPMGEKYVKVVQATGADLTGQGLKLQMDPATEFGSTDKFVTSVIQLKNVTIPEVQTAIQHVMHAYGKILTLERSNSIMITDTEANIKRARELIEFIDQATAQVEPRIYQIKFAEATEIASKINEIVAAAQGDQKTATKAPVGNPYARTPPGVIRAGAARTSTTQKLPTKATISSTESGSAVLIQGDVKVMADERTNIIIIFSLESNFEFFDKIIKVFDVEVDPATTFEVVNLEYADAVDLSGTLNDLIGAASGSRSSSSSSSSRSSSSSSRMGSSRTGSSRTGSSRTSNTRSSFGNSSSSRSSPSQRVTPNALPSASQASIENLNRLSEDTKILADERSNSILLMGQKADIAAIKEVIKSLDVMLEQVVIEAAIFEIGLSDSLRHGIDWLYRAEGDDIIGGWDGNSLIGTNAGVGTVTSGALTYYQNLTGLDSQILINLAATDNDARLISTPVIMTTDNTEASLSIGEQRPVVTSTDSFANSSGTQRSNYEYKDIGIQLTVTPRINPQRFVVMELTQRADQLGGNVDIDGNQVPIILNREFEASVAVPDGGTVVLGGLVNSEWSDDVTKIPILGDIPFLGRYLFSSVSKSEVQRELIVLMTPYVMTGTEDITDETARLYKATSLRQKDWGSNNWSESKLRDIPDPIEGEEPEGGSFKPTETYVVPEPAEQGSEKPMSSEELLRKMEATGQ